MRSTLLVLMSISVLIAGCVATLDPTRATKMAASSTQNISAPRNCQYLGGYTASAIGHHFSGHKVPILVAENNMYVCPCQTGDVLGGRGEDRKLAGMGEIRSVGGGNEVRMIGGASEDRQVGGRTESRNVGGTGEERGLRGLGEDRRVSGAGETRRIASADEERNIGGAGEGRSVDGKGEGRLLGGDNTGIACFIRPDCRGYAVKWPGSNLRVFDGVGLHPLENGCINL